MVAPRSDPLGPEPSATDCASAAMIAEERRIASAAKPAAMPRCRTPVLHNSTVTSGHPFLAGAGIMHANRERNEITGSKSDVKRLTGPAACKAGFGFLIWLLLRRLDGHPMFSP